MEIRESDAASSNIALVANEGLSALQFDSVLLFHQLCQLHQCYLVVHTVLECMAGSRLELVSTLYCTSKVLRQPGQWDRMLTAVGRAVDACLVINRADPVDPAWRRVIQYY